MRSSSFRAWGRSQLHHGSPARTNSFTSAGVMEERVWTVLYVPCPPELGNPRPGVGWEVEEWAAHQVLRPKDRQHWHCLFTPWAEFAFAALNRYGHTFVLYLKTLGEVKNSCHSIQRWSINAEVLSEKKKKRTKPPIVIMDKMRLLFKQYFPLCVWQILAV